jgi:CheY-like chemotaxis protein
MMGREHAMSRAIPDLSGSGIAAFHLSFLFRTKASSVNSTVAPEPARATVRLASSGATTNLGAMLSSLKPVVLVVEDDPDALDAITAILEDAGYDALRAANGLEALGQLGDHKGRCDLILLDLLMPVMNGWDFRRKQMGTSAIADIPVLLMSAGAHLATLSGELKAAGYVTKPVEMSDLLAAVRQHCP